MECLERGFVWLDTGTHEALSEATCFVQGVQQREEFKIGCIEETALNMGFIDLDQFTAAARNMKNSYGDYLRQIAAATTPSGGRNLRNGQTCEEPHKASEERVDTRYEADRLPIDRKNRSWIMTHANLLRR